ncbi:isoleucine--tRNA ligase [Candidatus Kaiserbacteria bacterium]|nr:MAG: isoleucine--tRNA ligase [Candidatus Kaiserbacteria bacterium]
MSDNSDRKKSDVALREEETLEFWNANDIFNKSVEKEAPNGDYVFYDGPPFATGAPHHGHLIGSSLKDAVPRYWTMKGFRVKRQWGWDCHGLPIENIVEKELGTTTKKEIEELGIVKFNNLCREKIFTYAEAWNEFIPRFGRWADMENPYRTMDKSYMESEWWAFKTLYEKGLVYEDYRSMHICPRCETTLAQSEVTEGYADIKDLAVTAKFKLKNPEKIGLSGDVYLLAWTTTPWTLPGNVALAVGNDIAYINAKSEEHEGEYIMTKSIVGEDNPSHYKEWKGSELVGLEYEPPFSSYVSDGTLKNRENAWKVYATDFVNTEDGTGIVHVAPAFGADDLELAQKENLPVLKHVGMDGIIAPEVTELAGLSVKPIDDHQSTDVEVIKYLAGKELLFAKEKYEHSYPHCWRCDTPLINYATSSWFVAVEKIKPQLLEEAKNINWSPEHIKDGRWGQWLEGARDWSISRQRFWANTIPVWRCEKCNKDKVFGSAAELEKESGKTVEDLHKDVVDEITVPCECAGVMKRVPDVLDTWFNSGSVPYASYHYPFENKDVVNARIPADFIAEGQDQISKWFYYQHVLGTALFGKNVFSNVVVNGIVLAEDGKKMSKRLQNYPDPKKVIDAYGADAMRLFLLSSTGVRAENMRFTEDGVAQVASKVIGRLANVYSFYELYKDSIEHDPKSDSTHILDQWIVARAHELHAQVTKSMDAYELDRATRPLGDFVDDLSTWYIRRSRDRLKSDDTQDMQAALSTIRWVLRKYAKISAPFTPFIADWLWQHTKREDLPAQAGDPESVHLAHWCQVKEPQEAVLESMSRARETVSIALEKRAEAKIKIRQPLTALTIKDELAPDYLELIKDEVNVKVATVDTSIKEAVELDTVITKQLQKEGDIRELIREIQGARKQQSFELNDKGIVTISGPAELIAAVTEYKEEIESQTNTVVSASVTQEETLVEVEKS